MALKRDPAGDLIEVQPPRHLTPGERRALEAVPVDEEMMKRVARLPKLPRTTRAHDPR